MFMRRKAAVPVTIRRDGRVYRVPFEKPVVVLHGDALELGADGGKGKKRFRLHVHGTTPAIHEPTWYVPEREEAQELLTSGRSALTRAAAAALALGTAMGTAACTKSKGPSNPKRPKQHDGSDAGTPPQGKTDGHVGSKAQWDIHNPPDAGALQPGEKPPDKKRNTARQRPPLEIRPHPPKMAPPPRRNRKP